MWSIKTNPRLSSTIKLLPIPCDVTDKLPTGMCIKVPGQQLVLSQTAINHPVH